MLLPDEKLVVKWLSQYQVLQTNQVIKMLPDKKPETARRIIGNLKKMHMVSDVEGGYLGLDHMARPEPRLITAVWVLLQFIDKVDPLAHYPAAYPSQLYFLKESIGYEIVVLYEGELHLTKLLQEYPETKYIIVLPDIELANTLIVPNVPCLFATVNEQTAGSPEILFYSGGEEHDAI